MRNSIVRLFKIFEIKIIKEFKDYSLHNRKIFTLYVILKEMLDIYKMFIRLALLKYISELRKYSRKEFVT